MLTESQLLLASATIKSDQQSLGEISYLPRRQLATNRRNTSFLFFLFFTSDHQTFCSHLFKVRRHVIGCINHAIVVGLSSELLMKLSYYSRLDYSKKFSYHKWIKPDSDFEPCILPIHQSANSNVISIFYSKQVLSHSLYQL